MNIQTDKIISVIKNNIYLLVFVGVICLIPLGIYIYTSFKKEGDTVKSEITSNVDGEGDGSSSLTEQIYVEASGAVKSPGVYQLSKDTRIDELIRLAGGFSNSASVEWISKKLNLSSKLVDSQKVYIPFIWDTVDVNVDVLAFDTTNPVSMQGGVEGATSMTAENSDNQQDNVSDSNFNEALVGSEGAVEDMGIYSGLGVLGSDQSKPSANSQQGVISDVININSATKEELDSLPGIGLTYAEKIILNRPYKSAEELKQKTGIPQSTISKFISQINF